MKKKEIREVKTNQIKRINDFFAIAKDNNDKLHILCNRVRMQTDKTEEEITKLIKEKDYLIIALLCESIYHTLKKMEEN